MYRKKTYPETTENAIITLFTDKDADLNYISNRLNSTIKILKEYSFLIRKVLSEKVIMKFLPKLLFRKDESFEYAEKIENLIKQTNK